LRLMSILTYNFTSISRVWPIVSQVMAASMTLASLTFYMPV